MITLDTRKTPLEGLATLLAEQKLRKVDMIVNAANMYSTDGVLIVRDAEPTLDDNGVTLNDGSYVMSSIFDEGLSAKLGIPRAYLRRMRNENIDLFDANVNSWLEADDRQFMVRTFAKTREDLDQYARSLHSDRYARLDHLDALTATLDGVRQAGVEMEGAIMDADLTDRRMVLRVIVPELQALAPELLKGYRSPFTGATGAENPTMFAGFMLSNSETGGGAWSLTPRLVVQICTNGMTITRDAMRAVHLGGQELEEGVIWSSETQKRALDLVTSKTTDAVKTFLNIDYMQSVIEKLTEHSQKPVPGIAEVRTLTKPYGFSEEHVSNIIGYFISGGQRTVGGVAQALTAYAQETPADDAFLMETAAAKLLGVGARR